MSSTRSSGLTDLAVGFESNGFPASDAHRGYTLVEVLVVVLLVGITVGLVTVNLGHGDRDVVRDEAERLAVSLQQAQDEAVMTGTPLAWLGEVKGYRYLRRGPDRNWVPLEGGDAFPPRQLPAPVRVADVTGAAVRADAGALVVLSSIALASPVRIVLEANAERAAVEVGVSTRVVVEGGV
jgi:general secretion pathway protein H